MITNAKYSFIQFSDCNSTNNACYQNDFYLKFAVGDIIKMQLTSAQTPKIDIIDGNNLIAGADVATVIELVAGLWAITITIPTLKKGCYYFRLSVGVSELCGLSDICDVDDICELSLTYTVDSCSQRFNVITDACYTEVVAYKNDVNEDFAGFRYLGSFENQIRLPIELEYPQNNVKKEIYKLSSGSFVTISASADKVFKLKTDFANEHFHDCMAIALTHDTFRVVSGKRLAQYFIEENYEVAWAEGVKKIKLAKAEAEVKISPYDVLNPKY